MPKQPKSSPKQRLRWVRYWITGGGRSEELYLQVQFWSTPGELMAGLQTWLDYSPLFQAYKDTPGFRLDYGIQKIRSKEVPKYWRHA